MLLCIRSRFRNPNREVRDFNGGVRGDGIGRIILFGLEISLEGNPIAAA